MSQSTQRPKILCLTSHAPLGEEKGARLRARHMIRKLNQMGDVRVVLAGAYENYCDVPEPVPNPSLPSDIIDFQPWKCAGIGHRVCHEIGSNCLNTHGLKASDSDRKYLLELMASHDLVWVHGLRVANGFNIWKWPRTILDIDDIPSAVSKTRVVHGEGAVAKIRALRQLLMWKRHEARLLDRFEAMAVCSRQDHDYFGNSKRVFVAPNGFEVPVEIPRRCPSIPMRIGFIGSLEYPPNANGLRWFLRHVWPIILKSHPHLTLRLVGRCSDDSEWGHFRNVEGLGWVADADSEVATWSMAVVPIFEGGGTRVKISYAFSRRCPMVSTHLGVYGYEVTHEREVLVEDSAAGFAAACLRLLHDPCLSDRLAHAAWSSFLEKWTWDANASQVERAVRYVLRQSGRSLGL